MRLERRETRPLWLLIGAPFAAIVAALILSGILIAIAGAPVFEAYRRILIGAFGSRLSATETLTRELRCVPTRIRHRRMMMSYAPMRGAARRRVVTWTRRRLDGASAHRSCIAVHRSHRRRSIPRTGGILPLAGAWCSPIARTSRLQRKRVAMMRRRRSAS